MAEESTRQRRAESEWIGLGEASRALGVNESTLRRWADAGLIHSFRTPGGHRRFSSGDLRRLIEATDGEVREFDGEALQQIRDRLQQDVGASRAWLAAMAPAVRSELAQLGRETVALVEQYLAPNADQIALAAKGEHMGRRYASVLRGAGVSLTDAVAAFTYFRRGMDEAVRAFAQTHGLTTDAAAGLWGQVSVLEDQILVALTGAYEGEVRPPLQATTSGRPTDGGRP